MRTRVRVKSIAWFGLQIEDTYRSHQVPMGNVQGNEEHTERLDEWMRSYRPDELFDEDDPAIRDWVWPDARAVGGG